MSNPDSLSTTIATYDRCAQSYVARNRRDAKSEMRQHFELFAQLVQRGGLVVDIGCGPGLHSLELARRGFRTVSLDLSRGMLHEAQTMGVSDLVLSDMRSLPLAHSCADGLWISASFLHVPRADAAATLTELRRALKPDGVLCLVVKRGEGDVYRNNLGNMPRFFILWHENELDALLRGAGLSIAAGWTDSLETSTMGADSWITRFATNTV